MAGQLDDALAWLAAARPAMERLLASLVSRNSFTRNPEGVAAVVEILEEALAWLGLETERIEGGDFGPHLAFRNATRGAPVLLVGHTDTVFPPGDFEGYRTEGDRAFGPGVLDMKGGIAVMLFALDAAQRSGILGNVAVAGMLVSDEEVGSPASQRVLRERARGARCALVFESGREGDLVVTRRKGVAAVRAVAHGVAAHAGNEPEKGRSAIRALARFVERAHALSDPARGLSVNVGTIAGGTSKNTVPAHAECEVDLRYATAADGHALEERLREAAREAAIPGTRIDLARGAFRQPLERTEASAALAAAYGAFQRESGLGDGEAPLAGGGSDASTVAAEGVPTIDGLGARGRGFHTPNEEIDLSSLVPKAQALVRFLSRGVK